MCLKVSVLGVYVCLSLSVWSYSGVMVGGVADPTYEKISSLVYFNAFYMFITKGQGQAIPWLLFDLITMPLSNCCKIQTQCPHIEA